MARQYAAAAPGRIARGAGGSADPGVLRRAFERLPALVGACLSQLRARRRLRIALLAAALALALLGGGFLWFRQSPFVAVREVRITGVHGAEAQAVEAALRDAAHGMSTLEVSAAPLRAAVAPLRVVSGLRAVPSFPHGLRIEVDEQLPVAALSVDGQRTAVAGNGMVLGPALLSARLPSVSGYSPPRTGARARGADLLAELAVLGAAPAPLLAHVERAYMGSKGLTVAMRNGLTVYFGSDARPHAKWLSLASVLADPGSAGASYVDVRLPSHPAAGFPAGVTPPDASAGGSTQPGELTAGSESTIAALAAALPGGSASSTPAGAEPSAASGEAQAPATPSGSEPAAAGAGGEASSATTPAPESTGATAAPGG
ncbi:MAG TPA: cell division protein FtsQ/DivIB [Solirubrobacteraceae bacterium]|jgi:cell division protein FtsQ|nr:cell division protein FtsQ/DivIB [Solirubrobacteraceae bacterium]